MRARLLPLTAGTASWNMAADQAILESVERSSVPTLRFYGWIEAALSLGYFQRYGAREAHAASGQSICVRRATGGGAILHHHELTYCLAVPMAASATRERQNLYRHVHASIASVLAMFGVRSNAYRLDGRSGGDESAFLCFQRRTDEDLVVSGYKVLGSAQRRSRHAVLQHGSLLLKASSYAPELPGVFDLTSQRVDPIEMIDPIAEQLGKFLGFRWESGQLSDDERQRGRQIEAEKFAAISWTHRR